MILGKILSEKPEYQQNMTERIHSDKIMSKEGSFMNLSLENRWLELQIATQCAPLLAGLKPSNLLILPESRMHDLKNVLKDTRFSFYRLSKAGGREVYLLYQVSELVYYLTEPKVQEMLKELGYAELQLGRLLKIIAEKYESHQSCETEFPHELGLVLGYPVVDVRGFMRHDGKNFLYSGYWKVYGNLKGTRRLFQEFKKAKEVTVELALIGYSIADIVKFCHGIRVLRPAV